MTWLGATSSHLSLNLQIYGIKQKLAAANWTHSRGWTNVRMRRRRCAEGSRRTSERGRDSQTGEGPSFPGTMHLREGVPALAPSKPLSFRPPSFPPPFLPLSFVPPTP